MPYRNITYVAFDGDNDIWAYRLMKTWKQNDNIDFNFSDAHDLNTARDTSQEESIKRQLRERFKKSKLFILLVGEHTKNLYKFVRWEIETATSLNLPIVVVNLNKRRVCDDSLCPALAKSTLAIHVSFERAIIIYSMDNWLKYHEYYKNEGKNAAYWWKATIYKELRL